MVELYQYRFLPIIPIPIIETADTDYVANYETGYNYEIANYDQYFERKFLYNPKIDYLTLTISDDLFLVINHK